MFSSPAENVQSQQSHDRTSHLEGILDCWSGNRKSMVSKCAAANIVYVMWNRPHVDDTCVKSTPGEAEIVTYLCGLLDKGITFNYTPTDSVMI